MDKYFKKSINESTSNSSPVDYGPVELDCSRNFRPQWMEEFSWVIEKKNKAYCKYCHKILKGGRRHLQRHQESNFHIKNVKIIKGTLSIVKCLDSAENRSRMRLINEAKLKICAHLAEHNLPFLYMEHARKFFPHCFPDSDIAKELNSRTKSTELIKNVIGPYSRNKIAGYLKDNKFSIIIDETTDISTKKSLIIAVRFYNTELGKVKDYHLALIELNSSTSNDIFTAISELFEKLDINIKNLIGFSSDNASVMMGCMNGVKAKFAAIIPDIFVMPCISHSLHLCVSKACKCLPNDLERLCHEIYNYFAHSAKRKNNFLDFQKFTETQPHQLLRPCQTRWLSIQMVVNRICEQWSALLLYFQAENFENDVPSGVFIVECLNNKIFIIYFKFLKHILNIVVKMNTFFQSEAPKFHMFLESVINMYKCILKFFLKPNIINNIKIGKINPSNPDYFVDVDKIYLGAEAEQVLITNNLRKQDLDNLKLKCLDFYIKLCTEIRIRVPFDDETFQSLSILNPNTAFNDDKPSLVKLITRFPNVITQGKENDLNLEWRLLSDFKPPSSLNDLNELIRYVDNLKIGSNMPMFPNLTEFLKSISCLPHSSAVCERLFSQLSIIKDKHRNKLNIDTCDALLLTKELLNGQSCFNWTPPDELLNLLL